MIDFFSAFGIVVSFSLMIFGTGGVLFIIIDTIQAIRRRNRAWHVAKRDDQRFRYIGWLQSEPGYWHAVCAGNDKDTCRDLLLCFRGLDSVVLPSGVTPVGQDEDEDECHYDGFPCSECVDGMTEDGLVCKQCGGSGIIRWD